MQNCYQHHHIKVVYITESLQLCFFLLIYNTSHESLNLQKCCNLIGRPRKKPRLESIGWILHRLVQLDVNLVEASEGVLRDLLSVLGGEEEPGGRQEQDVRRRKQRVHPCSYCSHSLWTKV